MIKDTTYTVNIDIDKAGMRFDRALAESLPTISRSRIKVLMENGYVSRENGEPVKDPAVKARVGDCIMLQLPLPSQTNLSPQDIPLDIVYDDEHLIVIDKPGGLVVHPSPGHSDGTLVNALLYHCHGQLSGIGGICRPGIVHRLDKDTSGLLVIAKNDTAHRGLSEQFAQHKIERAYKALVWGVLRSGSGTVSGNIGRSSRNRKKMAIVNKRGKAAITHYQVLNIFGELATLVECRLETGRTHQIRVHMSSIGHSIIGDPLYGGNIRRYTRSESSDICQKLQKIKGQLLHAYLLGFSHPITAQELRFESKKMHKINELKKFLEEK